MSKNIEKQILELFTKNFKLKFNEIEKNIRIRSNKLSYHISLLIKKGVLVKENEFYYLSKEFEYLIPYLSEKNSVISVILIHVGDKKNCFLIKRSKRPFKEKLSLPGGRMILGESVKESVSRIMKEKFAINAKLIKINSISLEHLIKNKKIFHSYILIFVSAKSHEKISLTNIEKNKKNIISSDYYLIKNDLNKKINLKTIRTNNF